MPSQAHHLQDPSGAESTHGAKSTLGPKHLVLVGAGGVHVQLLEALAKRHSPDLKVTLLSPDAHYWHAPRLADWLMGSVTMAQLAFPLAAQLAACGGVHLTQRIKALDVGRQQLLLSDGSMLPYDALSIEIGGDADLKAHDASLPGSNQHGLWIQPMERFTSLWPQIADLARSGSMRIAVVGDGQIATSLALGIQQALAADTLARPSRVSLISGANLPLAYSPTKMQARVLHLLKSRDITVLQDRCTSLSAGEATMACGARLASDATIVALLAPFPSWVLQSGLAKHASGMIDVDAQGQSSSHARVFFAKYQPVNTAGPTGYDLAWRLGHFLDLPPSDKPVIAPDTGRSSWLYLPSGPQKALGCWRNMCLSGSSVWRAMDAADTRALQRAGLHHA